MFLIDGQLHWSASDLTAAAACEFGVLRTLDHTLGRAERIEQSEDPLMEHIARLGERHESALLEQRRSAGGLVELPHVAAPYTARALGAAADATLAAFRAAPTVVHQAAFHDGEFFGYADFVERAEDGWLVCDAKLARQAKPRALLQLGAYADQLRRLDLPVSSTVSLLLGNGERVDFPVADVLPVFEERRERLRTLLGEHRAGGESVVWGDPRYVACGRCQECIHAAEETSDLILVAGLRMEQRRRLRTEGLTSIADLARATTKPAALSQRTFDKLHAQAALQWKQLSGGEGAPVESVLTDDAAETLALLPAPSIGDLFFDFEGDPLYDEGDLSRTGLEYLWGLMDDQEAYVPLWAHSSAEEKQAFLEFMDLVAKRRAEHPDMHIYHYAPYETSALKRLAMRFQTREKELDDLLRSEVFVDLYATVRGSVRVSAPSYSIKKLEPLYMGDELRSADGVQAGDASILAYHEFRDLRATQPLRAEAVLDDLQDYNTYDCLSTLRLRDWLLARAVDAGVRDQIVSRALDVKGEETSDDDPVFLALMAKTGPVSRAARTPEEQAHAMLATAIDYHRRERKQFWWGHFERLQHPVDDWSHTRDVFVVESAEVVGDWAVPEGRSSRPRRTVRLIGDWAAGSKQAKEAHVIYAAPTPVGVNRPEGARYGFARTETLAFVDTDPRVVLLTESCKPDETYAELPLALTPGPPPGTQALEAAIKSVATDAAGAGSLPRGAALDLLARRTPRLAGGLPQEGSVVERVVEALLGMQDSYVAIQGPPGTGKTWNGSRVIKELVERHHWRIGVVGQSHAVAENMLANVVAAGLDPALVGKNSNDAESPTWTDLKGGAPPRAKFLADHAESGCVLGGTAWTFANANLVEREGLDLLVVDEAGQFSLGPTLASAISAKRLLLLGDPQQLPQVSQGTHAEPVDESALGWLMDGHDTIPSTHGYFLEESRRMHPALCAKVSELSYDGRLSSAASASQRHLDDVQPGLSVVTVAHTGNRTESPEEALAVVEQVEALLGTAWTSAPDAAPRPLAGGDFLVVAPYNAQVVTIRKALDKAGLATVRVGTVDKFQGQEAPVAILSMTASSHGDVPRGMGFLLSRNRLNVALSRAQWRAILVRSEALTSFMPTSVRGVLELGGFIGLCQD
ncbi:TM0106 family RecB-like putative nuclease [Nocardioides sp. Root140]|uniref:TM0106 family RecB-like putative nuclease n=1 Tax=Nocardioides sp. Root140 TaxID=1736460 RepID=UPI0007008809|nr:bifunctional RecB family nuclease/DEAD/DEAH box helicase [Nocardioides sp. Root140]KQY62484.1 hypothetical protein ASD30_24280 [Nocardioides sp. Root140]